MRVQNRSFALLGMMVAVGLMLNVPSARAGGCSPGCGADGGHGDHSAATDPHAAHGAAASTPAQPIPAVLDNYFKIQAALASDSLTGVPEAAQASAKLVTGNVAAQAEVLAKAKDLAAARDSFKLWSTSLIASLEKQPAQTGPYYEFYCPMAKASWLQKDKTVKNPYLGTEMPTCGELKRTL